jgi:hypothetical protein
MALIFECGTPLSESTESMESIGNTNAIRSVGQLQLPDVKLS